MATLLLFVIYISFIGLGIPDSLFGTAWPAIYAEFHLPISWASFVSVTICCGTVVSSMMSAKVIRLLGTNKVAAVSTAMTAAETGQLVLSTLHTFGAASTVDRIIDVFPINQQHQIRIQLSTVLNAVVSQQLLPTVDGKLIPAFEIMTMNSAIRTMIREEKTHQIDTILQSSPGMQTMDNCMFGLYKNGIITKDTAVEYAYNPEIMRKRLM